LVFLFNSKLGFVDYIRNRWVARSHAAADFRTKDSTKVIEVAIHHPLPYKNMPRVGAARLDFKLRSLSASYFTVTVMLLLLLVSLLSVTT